MFKDLEITYKNALLLKSFQQTAFDAKLSTANFTMLDQRSKSWNEEANI
jgi:hypothetical protein